MDQEPLQRFRLVRIGIGDQVDHRQFAGRVKTHVKDAQFTRDAIRIRLIFRQPSSQRQAIHDAERTPTMVTHRNRFDKQRQTKRDVISVFELVAAVIDKLLNRRVDGRC